MNVLIQLSHPAHYHLFKHTARELIDHGHHVHILIKTKDVLEELLKSSGLPYINILPVAHRHSKAGIALDMLIRDWRILRYVLRHRIDILVGSTPEVAQVGWLTHRHRINFGEDDAAVVPLYFKTVRPFAQCLLAPVSCNNGDLESRTVHYPGYHKLAYLHPNRFTPDRNVVSRYFDPSKPYFLIRFAQLTAHHDTGIHGFTPQVAQQLIQRLTPHGHVFITSERPLEHELEPYRLKIDPADIHHIMAFATMYIGDSQSMAVEAAMLGVPGIRFNDFAGRIGVLEELEHTYRLTVGIPTSQPEQMLAQVDEWLSDLDLRATFAERRQQMLADKIDVTAYFTWFIEHYPESRTSVWTSR